jgi:hypothetical protein
LAAPSGAAFSFLEPPLSETLNLPVARTAIPFDPDGKTLSAVVDHVARVLRKTENEPEWVTHANVIDADCPDRFGLAPSARWPDIRAGRRLCLSVDRGNSEGWIISVELIELVENEVAQSWKCLPLMRIKTLSRSQAWSVAAIVSRLLDID